MSTISEKQHRAKQEAAQQAIYEAALQVISRADFDGLKMQDIASAAGIATGTLYNYFKNKEDLLYYVDRHLHEVIQVIVREISEGQGPADRRLREVVEAIFEFVGKYHVVFDLAERSGVPDRMPVEDKRNLFSQMTGSFEKILVKGIEQGHFRSVDVSRTAKVLFESIIGVFEAHKFLGDYDYSGSRRDLLGLFEDYLRPV